jgi:acetoacetate decarboxylase
MLQVARQEVSMASFGQIVINMFSRLVPQGNVTVPLWENARFILADVPLKVEQAKKILPWGMKLTDPPTATVFIADYRKTGFTVPYKEAGVLIHVKTAFGTGYHCCWMPVDDDTALIYGRELLGYPKKLAKIAFEETPESIQASVTRRGVTVLSMQGKRGKPESNPDPVFDVKTFNVGGLGQLFAVSVVWLLRPIEVIHESYDAEVTLELNDSELDPLATFIEPRVLRGRMVVTDIPGARYLFPVGIAGVRWLSHTFSMRVR